MQYGIHNKKAGSDMEKAEQPIAVFDSGVGGISVLRELVRLMPNENYIFYGDSRNAPYGGKSLEEVRRLTEEHVTHLLNAGAKAVVVACNTATSADVSILRKKYPNIPIVGIEPALKPAVLSSENPNVLVMATPMTIREKKFLRLMERYQDKAQIYPLACPGIVEFVERGEFEGEALEKLLCGLFAAYDRLPIDAVVLGCTHYPFIQAAIAKVLGENTAFFDGGAGVARETRRRLKERGLLSGQKEKGRVTFENSAMTTEKLELCQKLLNSK